MPKFHVRRFVFAFTMLLIVVFSEKNALSQPSNRKLGITAYCSGGAGHISAERARNLDWVIYSFLHIAADGNALVGTADSMAIKELVTLKTINPKLKILLSMGGWGGCTKCSPVFAKADKRQVFAASIVQILKYFGADGLDLDWEYPSIESDGATAYNKADRHNFTLLLQALRKAFGKRYLLSFAAGGFDEYLSESVEWREVMPLVDRVQLMTYDLVNGDSRRTGHGSPLFSTPMQQASAAHAVAFLDSIGVPLAKVDIGMAFYARVFAKVDSMGHGLYQKAVFKDYVTYSDFAHALDGHTGYSIYWDDVAKANYAYDAGQRLFATFDSPQSVAAKVQWAKQRGLGGLMFWEMNDDKDEDGLLESLIKAVASADKE
jgi:chitinase